MADRISFEAPPGELLSILEIEPPEPEEEEAADAEGQGLLDRATRRQLEFSCRGDRVVLDLLAPEASGARPLLMIQPAPGGTQGLPALHALEPWLGAGVTVCSIGLPLFGVRRSPKISGQLEASIAAAALGQPIQQTAPILWSEFTRQAVMELRRGLDAVSVVAGGAPSAVVFAGAGIAASLGAILCAVDDRIEAAVLALAGGGFGPPEIDPASWIGAVAPRPVLFINQQSPTPAPGAPAIPKSAAEALHAAAGEPKEVEWQAGNDPGLLAAAWRFLSPRLGSSARG